MFQQTNPDPVSEEILLKNHKHMDCTVLSQGSAWSSVFWEEMVLKTIFILTIFLTSSSQVPVIKSLVHPICLLHKTLSSHFSLILFSQYITLVCIPEKQENLFHTQSV